jgi:hypothetical protein
VEVEILPWLRKQEGFLDLMTLAVPDGSEVAALSFWDRQGNAQAYNSSAYPEVLKILDQLLDGVPYVKTFEVVNSTFPIALREDSGICRTCGQMMGALSAGESAAAEAPSSRSTSA